MGQASGIRRVVNSLVLSPLILGWTSGAVIAHEVEWRLVKLTGDALMLYTADTNEATDAIGYLHFECKAGSDLVKVDKDIKDKSERAAIAKLVLDDGYPTVELSPGPEKSSLDAITSSDASGWGYSFQISADTPAFDLFRKTGIFKFKIGGAPIQGGIKSGLDKIAEFQSACRKPSDRPKASK
ncbi:hypothetical protein [Bradyrhizobium sp. CB2312]|uniref:hypothetical protein n=1 Tax=Bradyrhizobium sp. CB2312 TaxID=3039155 RepID=UPI0024B2027B|nr:hypothetical protein [Bradyrhizobium sp. CB2312]WFU71916.1 hypothetical protein QA642_43370 [Bradyrhizobium sp. CB2312]